MSEEAYYRLKAGVAAELEGGKAFAVSFETGKCYTFVDFGALIVGALSRGLVSQSATLAMVHEIYAGVPEADRTQAVELFFLTLLGQQIAERFHSDEAPVALTMPAGAGAPMFGFGIDTDAELADILTLDPIHDVGPAGWPSRA